MTHIARPLHRGPHRVVLGGQAFTVPFRPADVWLDTVATVSLKALALAALDPRDADVVRDMLLDAALTGAELDEQSTDLVGQVTGTGAKWWRGWSLLTMGASWDAVGALTLRGADPRACTVAQWCAAVYALCTDGADAEHRVKFDTSLDIPPAGYDPGAAWDTEMSMEEMIRMAGRMPGTG